MLPPPVWVKPFRIGVSWPCLSCKVMVTGELAGAAAGGSPAIAPNGKTKTAKYGITVFMGRSLQIPLRSTVNQTDALAPSPAQNHVRGRGKQAVPALKRARFTIVVVAQLRTKND